MRICLHGLLNFLKWICCCVSMLLLFPENSRCPFRMRWHHLHCRAPFYYWIHSQEYEWTNEYIFSCVCTDFVSHAIINVNPSCFWGTSFVQSLKTSIVWPNAIFFIKNLKQIHSLFLLFSCQKLNQNVLVMRQHLLKKIRTNQPAAVRKLHQRRWIISQVFKRSSNFGQSMQSIRSI